MNNIKLSVAIPTYNGARYISEALDSIVFQLNEVSEKIEIVISDNASTDTTPQIIKEYQNKYPGLIYYYRNEENFGADKNIDLAVKRSKGEYVWLFSDDDIILDGGIKKVLNVLSSHPGLSAVFVNWVTTSYDLKQRIKTNLLFYNDTFCQTANEFLATVKLKSIFLSANVVNRSLWEKVDNFKYIGTNWLQYATLLSLIIGQKSYCIAQPYVLYRMNNSRWDKTGEVSFLNTINMMEILYKLPDLGYNPKTIKKVINVILSHLPRGICSAKKNKASVTYTIMKKMITQFKFYPSFWMLDLPLLILPQSFFIFTWKLKKNLDKLFYKKNERGTNNVNRKI